MKKYLSLFLVLALIGSMLLFTSCEALESLMGPESPLAMLEKAEKYLDENPYKMTVKTTVTSSDAELNAAFAALNLSVPMTVDGNNLIIEAPIMGMINTKMTLVGSDLYVDVNAALLGLNTKQKTTLDTTQMKSFLDNQTAAMPVSYLNFENLNLSSKDGVHTINCTGISTDATEELGKELSDVLSELGIESTIGDVNFSVSLKDGKYHSMELQCSYSFTVDEKPQTITMTMNAQYEYANITAVTAPADADAYQSVNFAEILPDFNLPG